MKQTTDKIRQDKPIIFGASGFIGKHLIQEAGSDECLPVTRITQDNTHWAKADYFEWGLGYEF